MGLHELAGILIAGGLAVHYGHKQLQECKERRRDRPSRRRDPPPPGEWREYPKERHPRNPEYDFDLAQSTPLALPPAEPKRKLKAIMPPPDTLTPKDETHDRRGLPPWGPGPPPHLRDEFLAPLCWRCDRKHTGTCARDQSFGTRNPSNWAREDRPKDWDSRRRRRSDVNRAGQFCHMTGCSSMASRASYCEEHFKWVQRRAYEMDRKRREEGDERKPIRY